MSNRFTRNIQNVEEIQNLPLYTNDQNDLISTDNMVYVRHNNAYEPILNKGVLGTGLTPEDVNKINSIIDERFKGYTQDAIKELNNDTITDLEQSVLNFIADRMGGLKFNQDGFKTSLNEVIKKLQNDEIADVQNLQREIEYIFDENNKSTSKKIDEVKSELSDVIDEKIASQSTKNNDPTFINGKKNIFLRGINSENNQLILQDEINLYSLNDLNKNNFGVYVNDKKVDANISKNPRVSLTDGKKIYGYTLYFIDLPEKRRELDDIIITYNDKPVFLWNGYEQDQTVQRINEYIDDLNKNLNTFDENEKYLKSIIDKLEQRIEKLENQ